MNHQRAVEKYVDSRRKEGASIEMIMHGLVLNGWSYVDAQNAVTSIIRKRAQQHSQRRPLLIVVIIMLVLIIVALVYLFIENGVVNISFL